jgi:integrase
MVNYKPRGEAAKLAQCDVSYLEKLTKKGELDAYCEKHGKQSKWYVNVDCPRFQKLLARLEPGKAAKELPTVQRLDWSEWEMMCRMGDRSLVKRRCSDDTIEAYRYWITRFFSEHLVLGRESLRAALYRYEKDITAERDYYASRHFLYRACMTVARYYVYKGYESQTFVDGLASLRPAKAIEKRRVTAHTQDQVFDVLSALQEAKTKKNTAAYSEYDELLNGTFILAAFMTAARNSELCGIRLKDINWREGKITLHGKGGKIRAVGMPPPLAKAIKRYLAKRPASELEYLFLWKRGEEHGRMYHRYFARRMRRLVKYVEGVDRFNPHSLRAAATTFMLKFMSAAEVRDAVGHAELATTNIYAQPTEKDIVDSMKAIPWA